MRKELRERICGGARARMRLGIAKDWGTAYRQADAATRCGAKTRKGTPCQARGLGKGGRCRFHGGMSTGPKTAAGKARSLAAAQAGFKRWLAARTDIPANLPNDLG